MRLSKSAKYVLAALLVLGSGLSSRTAQENETKSKSAKSMTVTGCLQKTNQAGEYSITSKDGARYGLRGTIVDLSKHVGHKVTVTGTLMREESEAKKEQEKKEAGEAGGVASTDLHVTNLKHISESCQ